MEELAAGLVEALIGMRAEIVALGLEEVGREPLAAIRVIERQRGAKGRHRDALAGGQGDDLTPGALGILNGLAEERIEQQIREIRILVEAFLDLGEERAADDAAAAPH